MAIATLIAAGRLNESMLRAALDRLGRCAPNLRWRDGEDAAEVALASTEGARAAIEGWEGMDIIVQLDPSESGPRRAHFVADMDSTMIGQECIDELADLAGVGERVAAITERAMQGELDFAAALAERVALLEGLPSEAIDRCLAERIRFNPGARTLVATLRAHGVDCTLVSGGFTAFALPLGRKLGFHDVIANVLETRDGLLTGKTVGDIVTADTKRAVVDAKQAATLAVGDGANDKPMIERAALGVAYNAKSILADAADARIDHHGLDALLWAENIRRHDWTVKG